LLANEYGDLPCSVSKLLVRAVDEWLVSHFGHFITGEWGNWVGDGVPNYICIQWKPLIMITLGLAFFDNNNRLITLSGGYKNLHYVTQFIITVQHFTAIKTTKFILKTYVVLPVVCLQLVVPE
jgi:hypothetical protein